MTIRGEIRENIENTAVRVLMDRAIDTLGFVEMATDRIIVPITDDIEEDIPTLAIVYAEAVQAGMDDDATVFMADALASCADWLDDQPSDWRIVAREVLGI